MADSVPWLSQAGVNPKIHRAKTARIVKLLPRNRLPLIEHNVINVFRGRGGHARIRPNGSPEISLRRTIPRCTSSDSPGG